ncbi:right-handed parallel beta-helix repeat-containing protein [Bacillus sp. FJAT-27245]|uniref:right-handed parallel beta-helix repeat-containing protein n=1 Tax=Bacillus sp. FJAT-27245 TaxID=1684144 RepID=UPI0006A7CF62|nr:right-handed parallel beta-helix repeat-containing protein [Bacillus sp. FJAT-27245]
MRHLRIYFKGFIIILILSIIWLPNTLAAGQGMIDDNKNGLDDNWEWEYGLGSGMEFEDFDNDGLYNLAEVKMGLNPQVADNDKNNVILVSDMIDTSLANSGFDMTDQLQKALNLGAGKNVVLPYESSYKVSGLKIPDNTILIGYGSKIYNDNKHQTLLTIGSGVKLYGIELQGSGNKIADSKGIGIRIQGAGAAGYTKNIVIEDVKIRNIGFYGILAEFADNVKISNTNIHDIGFAGIGGLSVRNMHIDRSHIKGISPGSVGNAYGVFFSRKGAESSLEAHPRSADSSVTDSIIEDIPLWEALDTHGGENITFNNNTIRNTKVGIAFVNATGNNGMDLYGSQKCTAKGNRIDGIGKGYGIVVAGASSDNSRDCTIEGNQLTEAGQQGNNISGAIQASFTKDLVIKDNTLVNSYANGIHLYTHNHQFSVSGNKVEDVQDNVYVAPSAIAFRSGNNSGTISGNNLIRKNEKLNAYVSMRGINISTPTGMELLIGQNTNNCVLPLAGGTGNHVIYILN